MINEQNTPGTGLNGDHVVYSSFFADNSIVQQTAVVHPKTLLIDGLRKVFRNDSIFTYRDDEYGFPLTPDQTGIDIDSEYTTKILISDTFYLLKSLNLLISVIFIAIGFSITT